MNILHLNTFYRTGGAAIAAKRLVKALNALNIEARILVQLKDTDEPFVIGSNRLADRISEPLNSLYNKIPVLFYPRRQANLFTPGRSLSRLSKWIDAYKPDLIHLNWVANGFFDINDLKRLKIPLVWTMHDMWAFTGGCHCAYECMKYKNSCGSCPQLGSQKPADLSYQVLQRKLKAYKDLNITFVAPSQWMYDSAGASSLLRDKQLKLIHNGIDLTVFRQIDKNIARSLLNLPQNKKLVLYGAVNALTDKNKGYALFAEALSQVQNEMNTQDIELVLFGLNESDDHGKLPFKSHYPGYVYDAISLVLLYSASDLTVVPSYQESFGLTAVESLACGTPVVAFDVSGLKDIVDHKINGYKARPYEVSDLANGVKYILSEQTNFSIEARQKAEEKFDISQIAQQYIELYQSILKV